MRNEMYDMELNSTLSHSDGFQITRVPGGWIYRFYQPITRLVYDNIADDYQESCCYVPFDNEYDK